MARMLNVAVVGGTGYLGKRALEGLVRSGVRAHAASRRGEVRVDAADPSTFGALDPFDVVVDATDTVRSPPDAWIAHCLSRGATVIEATSEAPCVERLHRAHVGGTSGLLVLGGGIFTGLSNLLARDVADSGAPAQRIRLGIASSPFSGAGLGTIELMVRALGATTVRFESGVRVERDRMERGPILDFGDVRRPTGRISLAEPYMLRESTGASDVDALFAPKPSLLLPAFVAPPRWLTRTPLYERALRVYFVLVRRLLLARVAGRVEIVAEATGGERIARRIVRTSDGMKAGGLALAAITERIAQGVSRSGACFVDDVCALAPIVDRTNSLSGMTLLEVSAG